MSFEGTNKLRNHSLLGTTKPTLFEPTENTNTNHTSEKSDELINNDINEKDNFSTSETESEDSEMLKQKGKLIVAEDRAVGRVGFTVYLKYVQAGGWFLAGVVLFFFIATQASRVINGIFDFFLCSNTTIFVNDGDSTRSTNETDYS